MLNEGYAPDRIVGHFDEVIICVLPTVLFFAVGRSTCRYDPNGCLDGPFNDGIVDIDCRRVELAGEFVDAPASSEGFRRVVNMAGMHRAGRGVRAWSYRWKFRRSYHLRIADSVIFRCRTIYALR